MPGTDGGRNRGAVLESHAAQGADGFRIVLGAGEDEASGGGSEGRGFFEQLGVVIPNLAEVVHHGSGKGWSVREARE